MSVTYTKLFSSITESTIWCEPDRTRLVWICMLAMADKRGRVWASIPGLANRARVPIEDCRIAIDTFLAPDPDSRTKDDNGEGKRIEVMDGGWRLINYDKYREMRDDDDRREQNRVAQEKWRNRNKQKVSEVSRDKPQSAQAEAEAEAETLEAHLPVLETPAPKVEPLALAEARIDNTTPAGILASVCVANGIRTTGFHPLVVEWARDGVTVDRLKGAIAQARMRKGEGSIPVAYLDPILRDVAKPAVDNSWKSDDAVAARLCNILGIKGPKTGEERGQFHARLSEALANRARAQVS